ncbi:MAG TPA: SdrD B-like domain-containing protein [Roseiflexaceae bacterium]|nr:SdrD B-like domain-containing protein [Roseiflexaceae bacterium]
MPPVTASGITWVDANCDGIRSPDEPPLDIRVTLFASGADGQVNTPDDQIIEQSGANGGYRFTLGQPGLDYRLVILPTQTPIGYRLAPYQAGDNRTRDNDFSPVGHYGTWATSAFRFNASATVTGIDLGACPVPVYRIYLPLTQHS